MPILWNENVNEETMSLRELFTKEIIADFAQIIVRKFLLLKC